MSKLVRPEAVFARVEGEIEIISPLQKNVTHPERWRGRILWMCADSQRAFARCLTVQNWLPKRFCDIYTSFGYGWSSRDECLLRNLEFNIVPGTLAKELVQANDGSTCEKISFKSDRGETIIWWPPQLNQLDIEKARRKVDERMSARGKHRSNGTH
jgi:hypothetical protein